MVFPDTTRSAAFPASLIRKLLNAIPVSALRIVLLVTLANMLLPRRIPVPVTFSTRLLVTVMP